MKSVLTALLNGAEVCLSQGRRGQKVRRGTVCLIGLMAGLSLCGNAVAHQTGAEMELAIVGARVYPAPDAAPVEEGVVIVCDGRIINVGSRSKIRIPKSARIIDARGAVLTAGFWNSHVHLMTEDQMNAATAKAETLQTGLETMLTRWGFITVFDLAFSTDNTLALRQRVDSGEVSGPMIQTVGDPFYPKDGTPIYVRDYP